MTIDAEVYAEIWRFAASDRAALDRLETVRYGGTSREIGSKLLRSNSLPEEITDAVAADDDAADPLHRITIFARAAALLLAAASDLNEPPTARLGELADTLSLTLTPQQLAEACGLQGQ